MKIINLRKAPGAREAWDRPKPVIYSWALLETILVRSAWQPSSSIRVKLLRAFGAQIGDGVIIRPGVRVKFPWKLSVGDGSWIGEDVWIHNQDQVEIGHDAVVSQGSFITTGSHAFRDDMALITKPVTIGSGAWVTSRCIVLSGSDVGESALILPGTVVRGDVPAGSLFGAPPAAVVGERFSTRTSNDVKAPEEHTDE